MSTNETKDEARVNGLGRTNTILTITPEIFEKLYLSPKNNSRGELRQTFGNPTPVAVMGLCVALTPLSVELMGWRGASGLSATIGANYWFGGLLLVLAGVREFLLGNTFPCIVFLGYGAHFLTLATTFTPSYAAISAYTTDGSQVQTPPFLASFGFYLLCMALLSAIFLICSLRTNAVFVLLFIGSTLGFICGAAGFWSLADGKIKMGQKLLISTGACYFVTIAAGWYLLLAIMLAAVDMPFSIPVFDLSTVIKGATDRT